MRPGGSAPPTTLKARGAIPPFVFSVDEYGIPTVPPLSLLVLIFTLLTIWRERFFVAKAYVASVTWTVKVAVLAFVGTPVRIPSEVSVRP